jgi:hypothetical protein
MHIGAEAFANIIRKTKVLDFAGAVTAADKAYWATNLDVSLWLSRVEPSSAIDYLTDLLYYSKCVNLSPPALLDLKMSEDPKQRYFPALMLVLSFRNRIWGLLLSLDQELYHWILR